MGTLVFVCPTTGLEVFTGLEMDFDTFADLPSVLPDIRCPHCSKPHQLRHVAARLVEGVRRTDEAALSCHTLAQGLLKSLGAAYSGYSDTEYAPSPECRE